MKKMKGSIWFLLITVLLVSGDCLANEASSVYSPIGKRDPFQVLRLNRRDPASTEADLFRYQVEQFELKAVLKGISSSQILVADPKGNTYILKEGDQLGRARATISRILDKEVILTEKVTNYLGLQGLTEKVLSLQVEEAAGN
ncbi:MAG: pilus assembly protein PilP [Pseudomonadota bacterium]